MSRLFLLFQKVPYLFGRNMPYDEYNLTLEKIKSKQKHIGLYSFLFGIHFRRRILKFLQKRECNNAYLLIYVRVYVCVSLAHEINISIYIECMYK